MDALSDVEILDAIGASIWDGVGAQEAMEDLLVDQLGDDDDDDEVGDEIEDALGAPRRRRRSRKIVRLARRRLRAFRREVAPAAAVQFTATSVSAFDVELNVIRPFKVQDLIILAYDENGAPSTPAVTITPLVIDGMQQMSSSSSIYGSAFGGQLEGIAQRPRIDLDTVNTKVPLTVNVAYIGPALVAPAVLNVQLLFAGIAARKR